MPRMRDGGVGFGVLPHVRSGGWDEELYLRHFAGRIAGNITIDEYALRFFFSLLSSKNEEYATEKIYELLSSHGYTQEGDKRMRLRDLGDMLEEIKDPDLHAACGEIIGKVLDAPALFPPPSVQEERLIELFELEEIERRILDFFLVYSIHNNFSTYSRNLPRKDQYSFLALITEFPVRDLEEAFRPDAALVKNGILEPGHRRQGSSIMEMELNGDILSSMSSPDGGVTSLPDNFLREGPLYPLGSFPVDAEVTDMALTLAAGGGPQAILLYGAPGSGKTEFARSLAHTAGKTARFFRSEETRSFDTKKFRLRYLNRIMDPARDLLVVDEAEELLRTRHSVFSFFGGGPGGGESTDNKSFINLFLEDFRGVLIFILNSTQGMDSSLKRRFHLSLRFPENNIRRRLDFWKDGLERRGIGSLFSEEELRSFAADFPVSAGSIAGALDTAAVGRNLQIGGKHEEVRSSEVRAFKQALQRLLSAQLELQSGRPVQPKIEEEYEVSEEILCTDTPLEELFKAASNHRPGRSLSILFSGPPGTGKTTLAGKIAEKQGRELRTVRASDILAPYVGQNEQNVRRIFSSTDPADSVLFIDEADSLFYNRVSTRSEWRQSLTNELLSAMESYPGILICATNVLDNLDAALMRRFAFKIRFRPLRPEQRLEAIRLHFSEFAGFLPSKDEQRRLEALSELTPGDIAAVRRRLRFAGTAETAGSAAAAEAALTEEKTETAKTSGEAAWFGRVLDELEAECSYRAGGNGAIGFV